MLDTQEFGDFLQSVGLRDFVGVPCSYLAPLINYAINQNCFIMSNNEGDAVAIASGISLARGNLACGDFLGSASDASLRRMSNTPHSLTSHNPKNSLTILECQESLDSQNPRIADSLTCHLISNSLTCHSEAIAEESKNTMPDEMFRSAQHDKDTESNRHCERSEAIHKGCRTSNSADSREIRCETNLIRYGVVLMQNSGLSNALSPLTSLNHTFEIPILGFVSLRGERDSHGKNMDEPQHELLGIITDKLLKTCQIHYAFLDSNMESAKAQVQEALSILQENKSFFFIVRDKTFCKVKLENNPLQSADMQKDISATPQYDKDLESSTQINAPTQAANSSIAYSLACHLMSNSLTCHSEAIAEESKNAMLDEMFHYAQHDKVCESSADSQISESALPTRLEALTTLHHLALKSQALLLATTGKCGRELYEIADTPNQLYMVGSMGCVSSLALGISLKTSQKVIAIDGDSALLMRLGALSTNAYYANTHKRGNFCHILLDNESHDSTGGQFNLSPFVDFSVIAKACGYANVYVAQNLAELEEYLTIFLDSENGHSVLSDFSGSASPCSLQRTSSASHSQTSHNPKNSSQALECQVPLSSKSLDSKNSSLRGEAEAIHKDRANPHLQIHKANIQSIDCHGDKSPRNDSVLDFSTHANAPTSKQSFFNKETTQKGATFIYLKIAKGSKSDLGRPKITPKEVARRLEGYIKSYTEARMQDSLHSSESHSKAHIYAAQNPNTRGE